jgi:hypothetical protein
VRGPGQDRMKTAHVWLGLDAGAEALIFFERRALLVRLALGSPLAATLWKQAPRLAAPMISATSASATRADSTTVVRLAVRIMLGP